MAYVNCSLRLEFIASHSSRFVIRGFAFSISGVMGDFVNSRGDQAVVPSTALTIDGQRVNGGRGGIRTPGRVILTIQKWVGHQDSVLISRVYGHLASEHTQRAARKVVFEIGTSPPPASSNFVDITKLTATDLIKILQNIQQGTAQALAA